VKTRPPAYVLRLESEHRMMSMLIEELHHHLKVFRLLDEGNMAEQAVWMLRSERLCWQMEEICPTLK
jgi:hypothetical protein